MTFYETIKYETFKKRETPPPLEGGEWVGILRFVDGHEAREAKILNGLHKRLERRYLR